MKDKDVQSAMYEVYLRESWLSGLVSIKLQMPSANANLKRISRKRSKRTGVLSFGITNQIRTKNATSFMNKLIGKLVPEQ